MTGPSPAGSAGTPRAEEADETAATGAAAGEGTAADAPGRREARPPLYPRLLRLRHVRPNGWQRAVLGEGSFAVAAVLVLADRATAWTLVVLPAAVAAVVKGHDLLAGVLRPPALPVAAGSVSEDEDPGDAADAAPSPRRQR